MDHKLYLTDPGIFKKNLKFFHAGGTLVSDQVTLSRLSKLRVPPAWENVWYASNKNCHIQVYGTDTSGKKQYILSERWVNSAKSQKYKNMKTFIRNLPSFKNKIKLNFNTFSFTRENLIFLLFNLLIDTHVRVGNEIYAETNETYGLTTLRQKHLKLENGIFKFVFTGKSKIKHSIDIPPIYNCLIKQLILPQKNKLLFSYKEGSEIKYINSEDLNNFLKENMGKDFTCKDFRTYSANILFIKAFKKFTKSASVKASNLSSTRVKSVILKCIDESAKQLGHTRSISRKSYISDSLIDYCLSSFDNASNCSTKSLLSKVWSI